MAAADLKLIKKDEYPWRHSLIAKTFEAEIKRAASEKELSIDGVMTALAKYTGVGVAQLYNYRSGKTSIPVDHIPAFCKQFESNALAMAVLDMCEETTEIEERDSLDLTALCNRSVREMLNVGAVFQDIMADGHVDGHEEIRFDGEVAKLGVHKNRMREVVRFARRRTSGTTPAAA